MLDGFKWGASPTLVISTYTSTGGLFDKDYDPFLAKVQPGVQQKTLEADRDNHKLAVQRALIELKDVPTGLDATLLKGEYTYRNGESILPVERGGKKLNYFFMRGRLWKIYEEIPLNEAGALGATYKDAIAKLQATLGVAGRVRASDPAKGIAATTVDWQDAATHLRVLDQGYRVGLVLEERQTLANLDRLRTNKAEDPLAMDPAIAAITKTGISDPNSRPAASASASSGGRRGGPPKR
jgi:hypothetical protein